MLFCVILAKKKTRRNILAKQTVELTIIDSGMNGEGVAKWKGKPVFVPGVLVGETVLATIVQDKPKFARAKVFKVVKQSPHRVQPPCAIYYNCGGCNMQHIAYQEQLNIKQKHVATTLQKQLGYEVAVNDVIQSPKQFGYRNKVQLPIAMQNGKVVVGFFKPRTHEVVPLDTCPLHGEWLDDVLEAFLQFANEQNISVYNENTKTGVLRHLVVRTLQNNMSIVVVVNGKTLPKQEVLIELLQNHIDPAMQWSLFCNQNEMHNNVIMGKQTNLLHGKDTFFVEIMGLQVSVAPQSFFQVNDLIAHQIYEQVLELVKGQHVVIDAYSGAGVMTSLISKQTKRAVGIEIVPEAVSDANKLKQQNNLNNVSHICADVREALPKVVAELSEQDKQSFVVVLDPPRKGCEESVLQTLKQQAPKQIVYVSCNPATLARDLKILTDNKQYKIELVQPYDMFPQTGHVETVVQLVKNK